jgi:hypothetical protein
MNKEHFELSGFSDEKSLYDNCLQSYTAEIDGLMKQEGV